MEVIPHCVIREGGAKEVGREGRGREEGEGGSRERGKEEGEKREKRERSDVLFQLVLSDTPDLVGMGTHFRDKVVLRPFTRIDFWCVERHLDDMLITQLSSPMLLVITDNLVLQTLLFWHFLQTT